MSSRGRSIEELVNIAKGVVEPKPVRSIVFYFLKAINASESSSYVSSHIIYYVFTKWCRRRNLTKVSRVLFYKLLRAEGYKEKQPKPAGFRAYHISSEDLNLSEDELIKAQKLSDKLNGNIYEKKQI